MASFDDGSKKTSNEEMVAVVEGVVYPWFGFMYRLDKIQFSLHTTKEDHTDHSREAIIHAQKIANLFIDEARLSTNYFSYVSQEVDALGEIAENDIFLVEVPVMEGRDHEKVWTEVYFF